MPVIKVDFACFVTCLFNDDPVVLGNSILGLRIPGFDVRCILLAVHTDQAIELYLESHGLPLTVLMCALEELGLRGVTIFTFGSNPRTDGAPDALARIRYRVGSCGFAGYYRGFPEVVESFDYEYRENPSNWVRFSVDQIGALVNASKPAEVVEWCVVICAGNTSTLESSLGELKSIKTGPIRQYFVKGYVCMRSARAARIFIEIEPITKTTLLRCLIDELVLPFEILTFSPDQQAMALAHVSALPGVRSEGGSLSDVLVSVAKPGAVTRFTKDDLAVWGCMVPESTPIHWAVQERDCELARLRLEVAALHRERSFQQQQTVYFSSKCVRFINSLEKITAERDRLRKELSRRIQSV